MSQHQKFLDRLANSSRAVFAVAQMQHAKGRTIEIPALRFAPSAADAEAFIDGGDLTVVIRKRIEVKHLGVDFTGSHDWPFTEVFLSNAAAVERAGGDVFAYVSVSKNLKWACIVEGNTYPDWYVVEKKAKNTGNIEKFMACPLWQAKFERLTDVPAQQ